MGPRAAPRPGGARDGEEGEDHCDHALRVELVTDLNNSTSPRAARTAVPRVNGICVSPARSDARRLAMKEAHAHFGPTEIRWFRLDVTGCVFAFRHPQKERPSTELTRWVRHSRSKGPVNLVISAPRPEKNEATIIYGIDDRCMPQIGMGDLIRAPFCQEAWGRYLHNFGISPGAITHELHLCGGESAAAKGGHADGAGSIVVNICLGRRSSQRVGRPQG